MCLSFAVAGCAATSTPKLVDGPRLQTELQRRLAIRMHTQPREIATSALANVRHIFSGGSSTRRVLAVVFVDPAATTQILGPDTPSLPGEHIVTYRNAVVVYSRNRGGPIERGEIRRALRRAASG